jgi:hypothetical protein
MGVVLARAVRYHRFRVCADRISAVVSAIANAYGCRVDEGSAHPCIIAGHDYGGLLYSLGVMGWLMLVSLPAGFFAFVGWLIFLIIHRATWQKRISAGVPPPVPSPPRSAGGGH